METRRHFMKKYMALFMALALISTALLPIPAVASATPTQPQLFTVTNDKGDEDDDEDEAERMPELRIRHPSSSDIMTSHFFENFMYVRGELVVIGSRFATYEQIEALAREHGGEIVGFLEVPNTYQIRFTAATEWRLHQLAALFNENEWVTLAVLNVVGEIQINQPEPDDDVLDYEDALRAYVHELLRSNPRTIAPPWGGPAEWWQMIWVDRIGYPPPREEGTYLFPSDRDWARHWNNYVNRRMDVRLNLLYPLGHPRNMYHDYPLSNSSNNHAINWGMSAINAPTAWAEISRLREAGEITPVNIGLIDMNFVRHEDIHDMVFFENDIRWDENNPLTNEQVVGMRHGTHVAGIIAATSGAVFEDNDAGVAGLVWDRSLFGYSLRNTDQNEAALRDYVSIFRIKHAIATLFAHDVRLINLSMALDRGAVSSEFDIYDRSNIGSRIERDALAAFLRAYYDYGTDFLIVQAAGDLEDVPSNLFSPISQIVDPGYSGFFVNISGGHHVCRNVHACNGPGNCAHCTFTDEYQPIYDRIIVVGNMTLTSGRTNSTIQPIMFEAQGSGRIGNRVDIFAPGFAIYAPVFSITQWRRLFYGADRELAWDDWGISHIDEIESTVYGVLSGTSVAASHVTGVAGLIWNISPEISGAEVKRLILENTLTNNMLPISVIDFTTLDNDENFEIIAAGEDNVEYRFPVLCAAAAVRAAIAYRDAGNARIYPEIYRKLFDYYQNEENAP